MPEALPFITLGLSAAATGVSAIQNADAQGEAKKQADAAKAAQDKLLAEQQTQQNQMESEKANATRRDAQLTELRAKQGAAFMAEFDPAYKGPSVFGTPGYASVSKAGSGAFGGL